jgi:peptidoglycan-N-acetylmuramic acid deacetylase
MKPWKILLMALSLSLIFCSCSNMDDKKDTSSSGDGVVNDVVSDVVSGIDDVVSDITSSTEDIMSDITHDDTSDTSSKTGDLAAANNVTNVKVDESALNALDNQLYQWGQGRQVDGQNRPISSVSYQEEYGKYDAYFIRSESKSIYLTFDEGYENGYTEKILDILKEKQCSAVFFVTMPYVKQNPDLIQRMIDEGHVVGNHTVNHPSMPGESIAEATEEIMELHRYVEQEFDYEMTLFRPPMGEWSERTLALTQQLGYQTVFWSFAYQDWETDNQPAPDAAMERLTEALHDGAIYLLHAVSKTNTSILGDFIDNTRAKGYTFCKFEA